MERSVGRSEAEDWQGMASASHEAHDAAQAEHRTGGESLDWVPRSTKLHSHRQRPTGRRDFVKARGRIET